MINVIILSSSLPDFWIDILKQKDFKEYDICGYLSFGSPVISEEKINTFLNFFNLEPDLEFECYSNRFNLKVIKGKCKK